MRRELLCALALLCGAEVAVAQQAPVYPYPSGGYPQGYVPAYPTAPRPYGYAAYQQPAYSGYYYQGYNYPRAYPTSGYPGNNVYYPQYTNQTPVAQPAAPAPPPASGDTPVATAPVNTELPEGLGEAPVVPMGTSAGSGPFHRNCSERFWVSADYMLAWIRPETLPGPLVTTGSPLDALPGALGQPGTAALFGDKISFNSFSGIRMEAGVFIDGDDHLSIDGAGFYLFPNKVHFQASSDSQGNPIIGRPIFNIATNTNPAFIPRFPGEYVEDDSFPGLFSGSNTTNASSELYGYEVNGSYHAFVLGRLHVEALAGFRYLHLSESLTIADQLNPLASAPDVLTFLGVPAVGPPTGQFVNFPDVLTDVDSFQTTNTFYGMQIGGKVRWEEDWFTLGAFAKLALGATQETVNINGSTSVITPTGTQTTAGGVLALPSNIGNYNRTIFGLVPEGGFTFAAELTRWLRVTAGYSLLYWSAVVRPGSEIDRNVNIGQVPSDANFGVATGPAGPLFRFSNEAFWVSSLNLGLEFHY